MARTLSTLTNFCLRVNSVRESSSKKLFVAELSTEEMSNAYYVSRTELLQWLNGTFSLNYTNIQQCGNGAAYCLIIDSINPGSVNMDKVNWKANQEYACMENYKILQKAFDRNRIDKLFNSEKLAKRGLQDNLEFLQWIKHYWEVQTGNHLPESYDAEHRRTVSTAGRRDSGSSRSGLVRTNSRPTPIRGNSGSFSTAETDQLRSEVAALQAKLENEERVLDEMERERNFYYEKLRDIEVLCQANEETTSDIETVGSILKILYATDTQDGFVE